MFNNQRMRSNPAAIPPIFSACTDCIARFPCYTALHPAYLRSFAGVSFEETNMSDKNPPAPGFQYSLTNVTPAEPLHKVTLTFPDGARREYPKSTTGLEIARG